MNPSIKIAGLATFVLMGLLSIHAQIGYSAVPVIQECCCGSPACGGGCALAQRGCGCRKCGAKKACRKCPKCEEECCTLEVKKTEEERTCYKTEQKIVCIPKVRLPWQKCCPTETRKTRTVNTLKKHKYKCPSCEYTWDLYEPELTFSQDETVPPIVRQPVQQPAEYEYYPPVIRSIQTPYQVPVPNYNTPNYNTVGSGTR